MKHHCFRCAGVDTPQARGFFSKIWLWALPFHQVIYIDTDILPLDETPNNHHVQIFDAKMWLDVGPLMCCDLE